MSEYPKPQSDLTCEADLDRNPDAGLNRNWYWTTLGRLNDILAFLFFPVALVSGLTGVGALTYFGMTSGAGPSSAPKAEVPPAATRSSAQAEADARTPIKPKVVKPVPVPMPSEARDSDSGAETKPDGPVSTDGRRPAGDVSPMADDKSVPVRSTQGWIYAGAYTTPSFYSGRYYAGPCRFITCPTGWTTRLLDFDKTVKPHDLKGKVLHALQHSKVRVDHPSPTPADPFGAVGPDARLIVQSVYLKPGGQSVWLKVEIYGTVLPLSTADLQKKTTGQH